MSARQVPARLAQLADDLRSLGLGAPVRAAYELSKRAGGHRLVLQRMASTRAGAPVALQPGLPVPPTESIAPQVAERTLRAADEIASGRLRLFGRVVDTGAPPRWHAVIEGPGEWPRRPWWEIDLRTPARPGDVKWAWELGRHRHLVVLARAAHLDPEEQRWATTLQRWLESWVEENPLEQGVHWASNLELALRAFAWSEVLSLAGRHLGPVLTRELGRHLWHTGHHLVAELPYTVSTTANNHLLGDALGLLVVGSLFPHPTAGRWRRMGAWLFERQAARQFRPDGSSIDDALSYDRFTAEMLLARSLMSPSPGRAHVERISAAGDHLTELGVLEGAVPQYGDWDEGRVLTATGDPLDLRGSVGALAAAAGRPLPGHDGDAGDRAGDRAGADAHDEVAWYPFAAAPSSSSGGPRSTRGSTGIARVDRGPFRAWLRAGTRRWHGHADLLSCEVSVDGSFAITDPGTGTYNGDPVVRDGLRTSAAHAVLRLDATDQLEPHRVFRWRHSAQAWLGRPFETDDVVILWGGHDAYRRLDPPAEVVRTVAVTAARVTVVDWVGEGHVDDGSAGRRGRRWDLTLPLAPGSTVRPRPGGLTTGTAGSPSLELDLPGEHQVVEGRSEPFTGWWSPTYGSVEPAPWVQCSGTLGGPVCWAVGLPGSEPAEVGHDAHGDDTVTVAVGPDHVSLAVRWVGRVARLCVDQGERQWIAAAGR